MRSEPEAMMGSNRFTMASRYHGRVHLPITGKVQVPSGLVVTSGAHQAFKLLNSRAWKPCSAGVVSGRRKIPSPRRLPAVAKMNHCLVHKSDALWVRTVQDGLPERPRKNPKDQLQISRHPSVCLESFGAQRYRHQRSFLQQRHTAHKSSERTYLCN